MPRFYFAWVTEYETVFGPEHQVEDEVIKGFTIDHKEGAIPTLAIEIRNPGIGLLAPGRKTWGWLSFDDDVMVTPLFFGQVIGAPDDLLGEIMTLQFLARAVDYETQKQDLAETLKTAPWYDPVFLSPEERDNPDRILEGYSGLWHVDRTSLEVTVSDVLIGEDALESFTESEVPYDSVTCRLAQTPLRSVTVNANVTWTQTAIGSIPLVGDGSFTSGMVTSLTGDGLLSDWPKPLASLGSGWSVLSSHATDVYKTADAATVTYTSNYQNQEKEHANGDTLSISTSITTPTTANATSRNVSFEQQIGFFDPYADPQVNIPASVKSSDIYAASWLLDLGLVARYDAKRQRSERVKFTLFSDIQEMLSDPEAQGSTDILGIGGTDVGQPLLNLLNWLTVSDSDVAAGQEIIGHSAIGEVSYQIATVGGHTGTTEPDFSTLVGVTTVDGTVTWTSMGTTVFATSIPGWTKNDLVAAGELIHPIGVTFVNWTTILPPIPPPSVGVTVAENLIIKRSNGASYQQCTQAGTTGIVEPAFSDVRGVVTADNTAEWTSLGPDLPGSADYQVCTISGTTGTLQPGFSTTVGGTIVDGTVTWKNLGPNGSFLGTPIDSVSRRSYFPTDRGLQSIEYLLSVARSHLRYRARAIEVGFRCKFDRAIALSCRKNARLFDHRLPGGVVTGKIVAYTITADGPAGTLIGNITLGAAVGNAIDLEAISAIPGDPVYVEDGVLEDGIQATTGGVVPISTTSDVGYSVPIDAPNNDVFDVFPLTAGGDVTFFGPSGSASIALNSIDPPTTEFKTAEELQGQGHTAQEQLSAYLKANPTYFRIRLPSVVSGPFESIYLLDTTPLLIPKQIDLGAAS